jgi:hypothetical protein
MYKYSILWDMKVAYTKVKQGLKCLNAFAKEYKTLQRLTFWGYYIVIKLANNATKV